MDEKLKEAMKGVFDKLTDEQKEQAKTCKSMDDFMKLAGEWGIELPDELTDAVAGGMPINADGGNGDTNGLFSWLCGCGW